LIEALRLQQFRVHYQPIVELKSGRCVGAEALLRWQLPDGSFIRPDLFIPLAEDNGLIQQLTDQLIDRVFDDLGAFLAVNQELHVSINLAAEDLTTLRVLDTLPAYLTRHGVRANQVCIEATERGFMDADRTRPIIDAFRAAGHPVSIDDFGTGYSSLAYLQNLHVDVLKIDKSFVDTLATESATSKVAPHIIEMAHSLGLKMVAEGIEMQAQADYLLEHGVQYGQGWLFGKAVPKQEFMDFCLANRKMSARHES
jgi:sensor c-di-GMP phosphodiesterase-like protein